MSEYNGHKDWRHWNVSLWINNDRGLYDWARNLTIEIGRENAARQIADALDGEQTPDGAAYDYPTVYAALEEIDS